MEPTNKVAALLLKKFKEGQVKNPRWSQRAFAQKLGVSSGALSEILKGKRSLSTPLKKKMAEALQLSPQEQIDFFDDDLPDNLKPVRHDYFRLSMDQFHLISDWWHFAILNLLRTKGFKPEQSWISQRLGLQTRIVTEAWDRLIRLGHLKRQGAKVVREYPNIETSDDFFDLSIRKSHVEDTKLIEKSLLETELNLRDHTSMTMAVRKKDIPRAKELIRIFQDQFARELEATDNGGDEVYRLCISYFPLTQIKEKP
jgi:transcriptional regulator with XRE-family HTH domain